MNRDSRSRGHHSGLKSSNREQLPKNRAVIALAALLLAAASALAQFGRPTGGIHGRVTDEQGGVLPGATVTIQGPGAPEILSTDSRGEFHAVNLSPATYTVTLALPGFTTVSRENVMVDVGRDTELTIQMEVSSVAASVTVSGEVPAIDTRTVQTGAQVTNTELREIPTARDPWVILQTVPGILVDRVNVGGSESGQQPGFRSKGSAGGTFQVDGVNVTDMSALGASNTYFDFDSFQEMQVITGGSDPSVHGSGAHLNMITKRGSNDVHGSARVFDADHHFQSDNLPGEAATQAAKGFPLVSGNHVDQIQDYGAEAGGPIWRDHLWLWAGYGRDQISLIAIGGGSDKTTLENTNLKLNAQIVPENSLELWYMRSDKLKFGLGAGPTRSQPTTWDQVLPQNTWKIQDSHVFSSSIFASAFYSGQNGNFIASPEGGLSSQTFVDANGVWHNTFTYYSAPRPQRQVKADVSYFFNTGSLGHELKAGFSYLRAVASSTTIWPGDGSHGLAARTFGDLIHCESPCAVITRDGNFSNDAKYYGYFLGDTLTVGSVTLNIGVRYDKQYGNNLPSSVPANPTFPAILPALNYSGAPGGFTWKDWQPRAGVTYALGAARKTNLKASYSRYAEALGTGVIGTTNPVAGAAYAFYAWNDANGDNLVQPGEVDTSPAGFQFGRNYNPTCASCVGTPPNGVDANLESPTIDEVIAGADHELLPGLAVSLAYTYRKFKNRLNLKDGQSLVHIYDPATGTLLTSADYDQYTTIDAILPDGTRVTAPVYQIRPDILARFGRRPPSGSFTYNRRNYDQTYNGLELTVNKRLANKWMLRGSFTYQINKQHVGPGGCLDPTNLLTLETGQTCADGNYVSFLNSKWQFNVTGLYQLPLGFNLAANVFGREGYPINYYVRAFDAADRLPRDVVVVPSDEYRYQNVYEIDLRAEKAVRITAGVTLALSVDVFNVTNENTVLSRENRIGTWSKREGQFAFTPFARANTILEIQSPRILRFGARISF